jgi:hypothetical protein
LKNVVKMAIYIDKLYVMASNLNIPHVYLVSMNSKRSLTILGMILGIAATGLVTAVSMSETALAAVGRGGGCGQGGCGGAVSGFGDVGDATGGSQTTGGFGGGGVFSSSGSGGHGSGFGGGEELRCGGGGGSNSASSPNFHTSCPP